MEVIRATRTRSSFAPFHCAVHMRLQEAPIHTHTHTQHSRGQQCTRTFYINGTPPTASVLHKELKQMQKVAAASQRRLFPYPWNSNSTVNKCVPVDGYKLFSPFYLCVSLASSGALNYYNLQGASLKSINCVLIPVVTVVL